MPRKKRKDIKDVPVRRTYKVDNDNNYLVEAIFKSTVNSKNVTENSATVEEY